MLWIEGNQKKFVPSLPTPDTKDTDIMDTFLAFRKGVLF